MSNLAFFAADTLGMTLYQLGDSMESREVRSVRLGVWNVETTIDAKSDLMTPRELTFVLTVGKMHAYVIVRSHECWFFVLAPDLPPLAPAQSLMDRLLELKPHIKGAFSWHHQVWKKVEIPLMSVV